MLNDILIWGALLVALVFLVIDKRRGIGTLTLAYFLIFSLGHIPGLLAYLEPNIAGGVEATKVGFDVTVVGMTAFIAGAMAARLLRRLTTSAKPHQQMTDTDIFLRLSWRVLTIGIVAYFVLLPVSALVPSLTAVASVLGSLLILGFWLRLYAPATHWQTLSVLVFLPVLPMATLATGGFIGFGTAWALSVAAFWFVVSRRRIWFYLAIPPVLFVGLSLFVTYFGQRTEIREVTWNENASMIERLDKVSKLGTDFQLLDLSNENHLLALDLRLNQNSLVGIGVMRHQEGEVELLYGATVPLWALIPRAMWPDKPPVGGGQDWVSQFTGITFGEGTSVGIGQVLEFYMNFGMPGVLAGFAVLGFILMRLDQGMMGALAMRNMHGVMKLALPGLALLAPLGSFMEILVTVVSAIITSQLLIHSKFLALRPTRKPNAKMSGQTIRIIESR
jgi:hypothetical protein